MPVPSLLAVLRPSLNLAQVLSGGQTINVVCGRAVDLDKPAVAEKGVDVEGDARGERIGMFQQLCQTKYMCM